jgi:hypothetical protein
MPTGYPLRGHKYRYLEARKYLCLRKLTMDRLIESGCLHPDGKFPTGERFWYQDTLDRSPIKGVEYTQSGR